MSRVAQMALLAGSIQPAVLTLEAGFNRVATNAASPITTTAQAVGSAAADRTVFQIVHWLSASPAKALTSATIGGIAAAVHVQNSGNIGSFYTGAAVISAQVPTGTTAATVLTFPAGNYYVDLVTYKCTGLLSQTAVDVSLSLVTSVSSHTDNIDVVKDGILLTGINIFWNSTSTLSGVTRDYNAVTANSNFYYEGGSLSVPADQLNSPITVAVSGTTNLVSVAASFR